MLCKMCSVRYMLILGFWITALSKYSIKSNISEVYIDKVKMNYLFFTYSTFIENPSIITILCGPKKKYRDKKKKIV